MKYWYTSIQELYTSSFFHITLLVAKQQIWQSMQCLVDRRRRRRTGLLLQGFAVCLVLKVELAAHKDSCVMPSSCLLFSFIQHLRIYLGTVLPKTLSKPELIIQICRCPNDKIIIGFKVYLLMFLFHQLAAYFEIQFQQWQQCNMIFKNLSLKKIAKRSCFTSKGF